MEDGFDHPNSGGCSDYVVTYTVEEYVGAAFTTSLSSFTSLSGNTQIVDTNNLSDINTY